MRVYWGTCICIPVSFSHSPHILIYSIFSSRLSLYVCLKSHLLWLLHFIALLSSVWNQTTVKWLTFKQQSNDWTWPVAVLLLLCMIPTRSNGIKSCTRKRLFFRCLCSRQDYCVVMHDVMIDRWSTWLIVWILERQVVSTKRYTNISETTASVPTCPLRLLPTFCHSVLCNCSLPLFASSAIVTICRRLNNGLTPILRGQDFYLFFPIDNFLK